MTSVGDVFVTIVRQGLVTTLVVTMAAWVIAVVLGLLLGIAGEHRSRRTREAQFFACTLLRSVPEVLGIYLLFYGLTSYGLRLGPMTSSILALGVIQAGFAGEAARASLQLVGLKQREAALSLGMSTFQMYRRVVLPQFVRPFIPPALNIWIGALKVSSIASAVGLGELLYAGRVQIELGREVLPPIFCLAAIYLAITIPMTRLVAALEHRRARASGPAIHSMTFAADR